MKRIIFFCLLLPAIFASCNDSSQQIPGNESDKDTTEVKDTTLKQQVDTLTTQVSELREADVAINKKIDESLSEQYFWLMATGSALGMIAFVIACLVPMFRIRHDEDTQDIHYKFHKDIRDLRDEMQQLREQVRTANYSNKHHSPSPYNISGAGQNEDYSTLLLRISDIETALRRMSEQNSATGNDKQGNLTGKSNDSIKGSHINGYLAAPIIIDDTDTAIFKDVLPSKTDKAYFTLSLRNNSEGTFNLISLQSIKSTDWLEKVIETEGVSIDQAKSFELSKEGKVVFQDGCWKVDSKLKIKLKK